MQFSFYGHACFGVETKGSRLLFDPFITPNKLAENVNVDEVPCDFMLISHGHEDHVADADVILKRTDATVVSNFEIVSWFQGKGFEKVHPMNHGGKWNFDFGQVKYVNAIHSSVLPDGAYGGNPGGFVIKNEEACFYYAGDTALTYDMKLIADEFDLDFAILPIGDNFTMGIEDAVKAAEFINCNKIIGVHFDTFGFIEIDHNQAKQAFSAKGKELILPEIGKTIEV